MSHNDDPTWNAFASLAEMTVRLFYGLPEVFVIKALLHAPTRKHLGTGLFHPEFQQDEKIAARLKLYPKYVRQILGTLEQDRIVTAYRPKPKGLEGEEKLSAAAASAPTADQVVTFWYIDFEELSDAVLYKLDAMEASLGKQKKRDIKTLVCPSCDLHISQLDIDYNVLLDPRTGGLACPSRSAACAGVEMEEKDDSISVKKIEAHKSALRVHTAGLHQAVKDVAGLHPPKYIRPLPKEEGANGAAGGASGGGGAGGSGARAGGGPAGGGSGGLALGASKGVAKAVGSGSAMAAAVPWMQTPAEAAAAKARAADAAAEAAAQAGMQSSVDEASESAKWEAEYIRNCEEAQRQAEMGSISLGGGGIASSSKVDGSSGAMGAPSSALPMPAAVAASAATAAPMEEDFDAEEGEEEMVSVGGEKMGFSAVTDEEGQLLSWAAERMSDAEYEAYADLCRA